MLKGFTRRFKPLEILREEDVEAIHKGILDVLEQTGVTFLHERALKVFEKNGCKVDYDEERVRIPPWLVEECLRKTPSSYHVKARDPKKDLAIGANTLYFANNVGMSTMDLDTWEPRIPTRKENYDAVKIMDALDNQHLTACYSPYFGFEGVPPVMAMLESDAARVRNSSKFTWLPYANDCEVFSIEMAKTVGTQAFGQFLPAPPLTYYSDAIEAAFRWIEADFPLHIAPGDVYGGTAPATIAGASVTHNAVIIAGIVLAQLIKPGAKVIPNDMSFPQNMRTGAPAFGEIGASLHGAIFNQIYRKYGVPTLDSDAAYTSSKRIDFQSSYERAIGALTRVVSGTHIMCLHGALHGELTWSPILAILDDDMAGMIGRFIQGVEVDDETLALDLINQVGPIPGNYLNTAHTRQWWKKEQFVPKAADRLTYPEWMKTGKRDCIDYAKQRMEEILATHKPIPLTSSQEEEIERILNKAREYYRKKGLISDEEWSVYMKSLKSPNYPFA